MAEGILKATLAHLYIAWIHPYGDGNGRTARLVEFMLLARAGIPFPSAHLMSSHFNLTRNRYYRELDRSSRVSGRGGGNDRGDAFGFVEDAVQGFVDGLADQMPLRRRGADGVGMGALRVPQISARKADAGRTPPQESQAPAGFETVRCIATGSPPRSM